MGSMYKVVWSMLGYPRGLSSDRHESKLITEKWAVTMNCFNHWDPLTTDEINALQGGQVQFVLIAAFRGLLKIIVYGRGSKSTCLTSFPELKGHKYVYRAACNDEDEE